MKRLYFKNNDNWKKVSAILHNRANGTKKTIKYLEKDINGDFALDFDNETYDCLYFKGGIRKNTGKIFPGNLSIGVKYMYNEKKNSNLTYLFTKSEPRTGRVENYTLKDEKNLFYREDNSKKISVFIPESYDGTTPHDILYFFDAQNLFCNAGEYTENGDPYGSWQLDVVIDELHRQHEKNIIVVGIDNADMYRSHELFMDPEKFGELSMMAKGIPNDNFSHGYLDHLSSFMTNTLHQFIKEKYCVNEQNIGIGGSSMGGIAAFYCGLLNLGFYSYVLSYSPAYGLYKMNAFDNFFDKLDFAKNREKLPKIHIYCGGGDPLERMLLKPSKDMKSILTKHGYQKDLIFETYDIKKPHNEESWRLILPESFALTLSD